MNHVTDPEFANQPEMQALRKRLNALENYNKMLVADCEDPKAIKYYRQCGFKIRGETSDFYRIDGESISETTMTLCTKNHI